MAGNTLVKKTLKKETKIVAKEIPVEPVPVQEPPVETPKEEEITSVFQEKVKFLLDYASNLTKTVKTLEQEIKQLQIAYNKEQKQMKKRKRKTRAPSEKKHGFLGSSSISDDLTAFLGLKKDEKVSRPDVTRAISKYVKDNNLSADNKSIFKPDAKLKKILGEPSFLISKKKPELGMGYTYFNLQSYLKKMNHFLKA